MADRLGVTEDPHAHDGLSVTPTSPGVLSDAPAVRCHQCGARLVRKVELMGRRVSFKYRKGARFCSGACRQRAFRRRNGGGR